MAESGFKPCAVIPVYNHERPLPGVVSELRRVRDKYLEFSKDATRLGPLRDLSAAFVSDLNVVITSHVRRQEQP